MTLLARILKTICDKYILRSTYPWQEHKLLSSPRKLNQKRNRDRGGREGKKSCLLKISFSLSSDFHLYSHHPSLRHLVSSLKNYNSFLTGFLAFFLPPDNSFSTQQSLRPVTGIISLHCCFSGWIVPLD